MASLMAHKQETVNFPQSQSVAQNLLSASMCEILYRRGILDGDLFEPITFAKNTLHKISDEAIERSPKAAKLYRWIKEDVCFAIKEKVLKKVCSSEKFEAENILEAYSFHFAYDGDKCSFELDAQHSSPAQGKENGEGNSAQEAFHSAKGKESSEEPHGLPKAHIQRSTENTVRSLLSILEQCAELPEKHFLSYAMFYNDDERSKTFKPSKDFAPVEEDLADGVLDTAGMAKIDLPLLRTGHHEVLIQLKSKETYDDPYKSPPSRGTSLDDFES